MSGGRRPGSGRPKGRVNNRSIEFANQLAKEGCYPGLRLAQIALEAEKAGDISVAIDCYKTLLPYVLPKLKNFETEDTSKNYSFNLITGVPARIPKKPLV